MEKEEGDEICLHILTRLRELFPPDGVLKDQNFQVGIVAGFFMGMIFASLLLEALT